MKPLTGTKLVSAIKMVEMLYKALLFADLFISSWSILDKV